MVKCTFLAATLLFVGIQAVGAETCERPSYQGINRMASLHFLSADQGYLEMHAKGKKKIMTFEITYSNGFSREYILIASIKDLDSVVMPLNPDFTPAQKQPASFLITPDLSAKYYYATMMNSALHDFLPDDTWKFVKCDPHWPRCLVRKRKTPWMESQARIHLDLKQFA